MLHIAMLYRIEVDAIHVGGMVPIVANGVLPISSLPYAAFAMAEGKC